MKIVLWAFHEAGYRALRKLYTSGHDLLIFTEENSPYVPSVAELAMALGQSVYVGISDDLMREIVGKFLPDLGLSMYYPRIIKEEVLAIPRIGAFNFHPALLPRHRGCFSAPWAIIEGDKETGITCHEMVAQVDCGKILCQSRVVVAKGDTAFSLYYKLVDSAATLLDAALIRLAHYPITLTEQNEGGCYHGREIPCKGQIDTDWPMEKVERFIRALYFPPHPPAELVIGDTGYPVYSMDEYKRLLGKLV